MAFKGHKPILQTFNQMAATHVNTHTHAHTHTHTPLPHRNAYKIMRIVWDKKKVTPHRTTHGKWPEIVKSGWLMTKAEWMADGKGTHTHTQSCEDTDTHACIDKCKCIHSRSPLTCCRKGEY